MNGGVEGIVMKRIFGIFMFFILVCLNILRNKFLNEFDLEIKCVNC